MKKWSKLKRVNCMIVAALLVMIVVFIGYAKDKVYRGDAERREAYFASLWSGMMGADLREGDTLDDVLERREQANGEQVIIFHMVLFNYGDPREQKLSDFLTLRWKGQEGSKVWVIEEKSPMKVSLFEKDRLIMDQMGSIHWEGGRPITSEKWSRAQ